MKKLFGLSFSRVIALLLLPLLLSACFYPDSGNSSSQAATMEHLMVVQHAVDLYQRKTGVLPIKNNPSYTPLYQQNVIDFKKILDRNYLSAVPADAYEKGGSAIYVLINAETAPEVKLLDLVSLQKVGDIQNKVEEYVKSHQGQLPFGEEAAPHFYWLDEKKLKMKELNLRSIYSGRLLNVIMSEAGRVAIDYGPDIMQLLQREDLQDITPELDLRTLLLEESFYVPVASFPYHISNGDPLISLH